MRLSAAIYYKQQWGLDRRETTAAVAVILTMMQLILPERSNILESSGVDLAVLDFGQTAVFLSQKQSNFTQ